MEITQHKGPIIHTYTLYKYNVYTYALYTHKSTSHSCHLQFIYHFPIDLEQQTEFLFGLKSETKQKTDLKPNRNFVFVAPNQSEMVNTIWFQFDLTIIRKKRKKKEYEKKTVFHIDCPRDWRLSAYTSQYYRECCDVQGVSGMVSS